MAALRADLHKQMEVLWLLSKNGKFLYRFVPTFELSQSIHEIKMMEALHTYAPPFGKQGKQGGVGRLLINRERVSIVVTSLKDIVTVILSHFEKYPLMGGKFVSYLLFRKVVLAMYDNYHLTARVSAVS